MSIESSFPIYYNQNVTKPQLTLSAPKVKWQTFPLMTNATLSETYTNDSETAEVVQSHCYDITSHTFLSSPATIEPHHQYKTLNTTSPSLYPINYSQRFQFIPYFGSKTIKINTDVLNFTVN